LEFLDFKFSLLAIVLFISNIAVMLKMIISIIYQIIKKNVNEDIEIFCNM